MFFTLRYFRLNDFWFIVTNTSDGAQDFPFDFLFLPHWVTIGCIFRGLLRGSPWMRSFSSVLYYIIIPVSHWLASKQAEACLNRERNANQKHLSKVYVSYVDAVT